MQEARSGLERCRADFTRLTAERKELEKEIQKLPQAKRPNLTAWDDRLKKMKESEREIVFFIESIDKIQQVENDPERVKWLAEISRARLLEEKYEYGQAIEIYENARKVKSLDSADLRDRIAKLRKDWDPQGAKHEEARKFIYQVWPTLDTPGLKARLAEATAAFAECKRVGDFIGPQKMMEAMLLHRQRIEKELKPLKPNLTKEDEDLAKVIEEVTTEMGKLETELNAFLKSASK